MLEFRGSSSCLLKLLYFKNPNLLIIGFGVMFLLNEKELEPVEV